MLPILPVNSKLLGVALLNLEVFILTFFIFCKTAYKMHDILGYAVNLQYEYLKNEIPDILSK